LQNPPKKGLPYFVRGPWNIYISLAHTLYTAPAAVGVVVVNEEALKSASSVRIDEADVAVVDKRDEATRMLQYKATPQDLQKLRADLSDDGGALLLFWKSMRSSFLQLYAVSSPSIRPSPSLNESSPEAARRWVGSKTLSGERISLSSLRVENEIYIRSFHLDHRRWR
jgi:hypothetical protein